MFRSAVKLQKRISSLQFKAFKHNGVTQSINKNTILSRHLVSSHIVSNSNESTPLKNVQCQYGYLGKTFFSSGNDLPTHQKIPLPALSPTMEMGTIISWEKKEGDKVNEGDLLAEIETDKATMGFEATEEGYLAKICVPAGSKDVPLGKLLCIIVENEEDIAAFKDFTDTSEGVVPAEPVAEVPVPTTPPPTTTAPSMPPPPSITSTSQPVATASPTGRIFASPLAKKLASEKGIDLSVLQGSGPSGRIRAQDVESAKESIVQASPQAAPSSHVQAVADPSANYVDMPTSAIKQETARQYMLSKQTIPHYYLTIDIVVDKFLSLKDELNETLKSQDTSELTTSDMIVKAAALACKKIPEANSSWQDTFIRQYNTVNMNVVMSAGDNVSVSPLISSAEKKGLTSINAELNNFALRISDGSLLQEQPQVGTFTVSSLGMYGVKNVINSVTPPQSCCLGVGAIQERLIVDESEKGYKTVNVISATLSCDHRVIDGAVGAQWLKHFKELLEKPHLMLL